MKLFMIFFGLVMWCSRVEYVANVEILQMHANFSS